MIKVKKVKALRLALHISNGAKDYQEAFQYVKLEAGGRLIATDGFALFVSRDAHDSDETVFVKPEGKAFKVAKGALSVTIDETGTLTEVTSSRARKLHAVTVKRKSDSDMPSWPDVERVIPAPGEPIESNRVVDSIRGGDIAKVYGVNYGAWMPTATEGLFHLNGMDAGDNVFLSTLRDQENDWNAA